LEELGGSKWPDSFSFFYPLVSRAASSAMAYLLAIANISSSILGLFMASLRIKDESLLEEHDDGFIVDLREDVPLVAEVLNKLPKGLSFLLHHIG
jgi:hypothetical protein